MKLSLCKSSPSACLGLLLGAASVLQLAVHAQSPSSQPAQPVITPQSAATPQRAITLDPPIGWELQSHLFDSSGKPLHEGPAYFRRIGEARVGEPADLHSLTLRFADTVKLTGIQSTRDFRIESGGSCVVGNVYQAKGACTLLIRFTPQGPGRRLGRINISHSGSSSPTPFVVSGFSYAPVVSFVPSVITTVPATYPNNIGLLSGAVNMAFDGGDTLYIADRLNSRILFMDSSGTIKTPNPSGTATPPYGIAVDSVGVIYYSEPSSNLIRGINQGGIDSQVSGSSTDSCRVALPCLLPNETAYTPGSISIDSNDTMIFADSFYGAAISQLYPRPSSLIRLEDAYSYSGQGPAPFAADAASRLYSSFPPLSGFCEIGTVSLADAESFALVNGLTKFAGDRTCGFSGDGGLAKNAQISSSLGQFAFDQAGDFYFADAGNQRVRRVDPATGIIRTIAGNGVQGFTGDGGNALLAELQNPTGIAVNSLGAVYIISGTDSGQVVRKVGPAGYLNFGNLAPNISSAPLQLKVTNTGNVTLNLANTLITGPNAADFTIDPATTNCVPTPGYLLSSGQTCAIGIVFKPSAGGSRNATLTLVDNTVTGFDTAALHGNGLGTNQSIFVITSPADGSSFKSTVPITFSATVSSPTGAPPTGTVQFKVDNANWGGPVTLVAGKASTTVSGLSITGHTLSATYNGDSNYAAAGPIFVGVTITQIKIGASVSLSPTVSTGGSCASPQFVATVTGKPGQVPTGQVQLLDAGAAIAAGTLQNGRIVLAPHQLSSGPHWLTANYSGDKNYEPSISPALIESISAARPCKGPITGSH
jgi:hypothetical protein